MTDRHAQDGVRGVGPDREERLRALEQRIGYRFRDLGLLDRALTHTSRANEDLTGTVRHNEALEFLGDAVLGLVVTDLLHRRDPEGTRAWQACDDSDLAGRSAAGRRRRTGAARGCAEGRPDRGL